MDEKIFKRIGQILVFVLAFVCVVALVGMGTRIRALTDERNDAQRDLAEYRFLAGSTINGLVANNRSLGAELEQQRGNNRVAIESIQRAITISENSASAYDKLGALSRQDRELLDRLRNNLTQALRIVKQQLEGSGQQGQGK